MKLSTQSRPPICPGPLQGSRVLIQADIPARFIPLSSLSCFSSALKLPLDFSVDTKDCCLAIIRERVEDLCNNATDAGKILNGLDFPCSNGNLEPNAYATNLTAWDVMCGLHCLASCHVSDGAYALGPGWVKGFLHPYACQC